MHKRVGLFALDSTPCSRNRQHDHDPWSTLFAVVRQAKHRELLQGIIKVSSHQQMGFSDVIERWAFQGHESADRTAASTRQMLPPSGFWAWTQFDDDLQIRQKACHEFHSMLVQFGLRCVETKVDQAERDEQKWDEMHKPHDLSLVGLPLPKVLRTRCVLHSLTSKCASRHNDAHFFDISTSKSSPKMVCFVHVDFKMCFAPQRRAIFHLSSPQMSPHPPL